MHLCHARDETGTKLPAIEIALLVRAIKFLDVCTRLSLLASHFIQDIVSIIVRDLKTV
jgi:hypothetical protein